MACEFLHAISFCLNLREKEFCAIKRKQKENFVKYAVLKLKICRFYKKDDFIYVLFTNKIE